MLCPRGSPRDKVTLIVCACPTWGILANFEKMLAPGSGSFNNVTEERDLEIRILNAPNERGAWMRVFCHLGSTPNSEELKNGGAIGKIICSNLFSQ